MLWRNKDKKITEEVNKQILTEFSTLKSEIEAIHNGVMVNQKALKKYGLTLEEVIDTIERESSQKNNENQKLQEMSEQRNQLLEVILYYQEQLYRMNRILEENENWSSSIKLLEKEEGSQLNKNGMNLINEIGTLFTFELHEIIDTIDTENEEQNERIAKIHVPGLIYHGKVVRKAKVMVFRYHQKAEEN